MPDATSSRRQFLAAMGALGLGAVAAACTSKTQKLPPAPGSMNDMKTGATQLSVLSTNTPVNPGKQRFGFDLTTPQGQLITGGQPQIWVATSEAAPAVGPFDATWHPFTAYAKTHDKSPESPLSGVFTAEIDIPTAGNWFVAATIQNGTGKGFGSGGIPATNGPVPVQLGTKAVSVKTPVATSKAGLKQICTRNPVCDMHAVSLDRAFTSGKPTAIAFATPLLCESRLCGPVTDELILVWEQLGHKANFVHVEEFLPGPDLKPPAPSLGNQSPGFKAWKLRTEPWVVLVDKHGVIRWNAEGPVTAPEIEAALTPLL
jgi:hypothetical protein